MRKVFIGFILTVISIQANANFAGDSSILKLIEDIVLKVDTMTFNYKSNRIIHKGEPHFAFKYNQDEQVIEIRLFPKKINYLQAFNLSVLPSGDFDLLDSIALIDNTYYKFRLRFKSIHRSDFLNITFRLDYNDKVTKTELKLFPYILSTATFYPGNDDLYIGEEKRFEIVTNQINNLKLDGEWKYQGSLEYRLVEKNGTGYIDILSTGLGAKSLDLVFETNKPFIDEKGKIHYSLDKQTFNFNVRGSRLSFLKIDKREIVKTQENREGIEIQLDNHRNMQINKTYRIEDREEKGGFLLAELYTLRRLSNDKILCVIRPYAYHRVTDGYMFIKDGDDAQYITNVNIVPEAKIHKIKILREGQDWSSELVVKPGETVEVRFNGEGLERAFFYFEDLEDVSHDSMTRNDKTASYKIRIPINIRKKQIDIYNLDKNTGFSLQVKEFQRPRPLDFINVNYGDGEKKANSLNHLILYKHSVRDVVLSFDAGKIDRGDYLYGKQILELEIRIIGAKDELIEMQKIDYLEICPSESSPRSAFYDGKTCNKQDIRINSYLSHKTHNIEAWSKIELIIRHKKNEYEGEGYTQKIVIVMQQLVSFDVEVSFPAGLIIKRVGETGFPGLSGISLAMISQFSFYDRERIRRPKPYKIGAGFLAQNALNFNPDVQRDLGIILIGSVYPTRKESKLSFPLYAGFGYFLNEDKFFYLVGPGIRISL